MDKQELYDLIYSQLKVGISESINLYNNSLDLNQKETKKIKNEFGEIEIDLNAVETKGDIEILSKDKVAKVFGESMAAHLSNVLTNSIDQYFKTKFDKEIERYVNSEEFKTFITQISLSINNFNSSIRPRSGGLININF